MKPSAKTTSIAGLMMYVSKRYIMFATESIRERRMGVRLTIYRRTIPLLVVAAGTGVYLNAFWNDGVRRGHLEGTLQEADDAPDGNHDENSDDAIEHDLQALVLLFANAHEAPNEPPEEDYDGKCDEKPYQGVQKRVDESKGVEKRRSTRERGKCDCRRRKN